MTGPTSANMVLRDLSISGCHFGNGSWGIASGWIGLQSARRILLHQCSGRSPWSQRHRHIVEQLSEVKRIPIEVAKDDVEER